MNNRRRLLVALSAGALAAPLRSLAQEKGGKVARIGFLGISPEADGDRAEAFKEGLREKGWIESQNIVIEYRWSRGNTDRISELVADLIRINVDVILAPSSTYVELAKRATSTIPIVFAANADPVGLGHVASLRHPGGNITGVSMVLSDMAPKELELLKEMLPGASRIGVLWNPTTPSNSIALKATEHAAEGLKLRLRTRETRTADDFESAFLALSKERVDAVLELSSPLSRSERWKIAALALKFRLPLMVASRERAVAGALVSYGADPQDLYRLSASYVDKILRGAKPGDLPVEQPTKFELVINMKTAKALGLTIPQSILLRANEVIQ
jgi:putative ABC transport system substrate-binding protein